MDGRPVYRIRTEQPANVERLPDLDKQHSAMRSELRGEIERAIANGGGARERARAAYLAICLDLAPELQGNYPEKWERAIGALTGYARVMQAIFFEAPFPTGDAIRSKALAAGLRKPEASIRLWAT